MLVDAAGTISKQQWVDVSCLLFLDRYPVNTRHRRNVGPMLGQGRRRWTNIGPALRRRLVFAGYRYMYSMVSPVKSHVNLHDMYT